MNIQSKSLLKVIVSVGTAVFLLVALTITMNLSVLADNTYQTLPFNQDWSDTSMITVDDDWSGVPGIVGYRGDGLASINQDPQTILADGTSTPVDVNANETNPDTLTAGGTAEFEITDPVAALQGSGTADAPFFLINLDTSGSSDIQITYNLRDLDGSTANAVQQVALHYRVGNSGDFTNLPDGYVADATTGPSQATLVTPVTVTLPANANNQSIVQLRVMTTNASGSDEWVGVDDIAIASKSEGVSISKSVTPNTNIIYQESVTYTVVLNNSASVSDTNVIFTDSLPISTTFNSWVEQPAGAFEMSNKISWAGTVTNSEAITFTFVVDQDADYSETITNTAEFSGTATTGTAQASFAVEEEPILVDLSVEKTAPVYAMEDEIINYTVIISNDGAISVDNVLFTDTLPTEIAYSSADLAFTSNPSNGVYVWDIGTMASGTAVTINLTGTITNTISATTLVTNTAEVSTSTVGDSPNNNTAKAETTVYPIVPIATARAGSNGDIFAVEGKVIVIPGTYNGTEWALQDASGGISNYFTPPPTVQLGDTVRQLGNKGAYNGQEQFTSSLYFRNVSSGPEVAPTSYTTEDVNDGLSEGWLVVVSGTISDLDCPSSYNYSFSVDDGTGPVDIYIDGTTGIEDLCDMGIQDGDTIGITGFSTEYDGTYQTYQIKPRRPSDINLGVLRISKDAPQLVQPGDLFTYTLTADNQTGETLTNIVISDVVPANTTFAYALDSGVESGGTVTWDVTSLAHANTVSVQFAVTATNNNSKAINDNYAVFASNHLTPVAGSPTITYIDSDPNLHIYHVQGDGFASPFVGQEVTVSGEVIADFQGNDGMRGFFMQDPVGDGDMLTSDGIFVYDYYLSPSVDVNVGEIVTVTGEVAEHNNNTQVSNVSAIVTETNRLSIAPALVTLPETTDGDLERYEGMYVSLPQVMTVTQNYFQGQFGQVSLSASGRLFQPTNVYTPTSPEAVALADSNARNLLVLDDGSTAWNNEPVPYIGISGTLRAGDSTSGLMGVLDEGSIDSRSAIDYRLQPLTAVTFDRVNDRADAPEDVGGRLQIASFNVLNYFTTLGSSEICGPEQDLECRGADNESEFERQRTKIITALVSIDADVVGLMEIENNETAAITDLVTGLNDEVGAGTYDFIDTGYIGGDAIKVAMIYQPAKVTPVGTTAVLTDIFPFDTNTRPPLAQAFVENDTGHEFIVVVNHFKSKGSSCDALGDPNMGDGQGNCNLTRVQAADELVSWLDTDPTGTGDPDIFIIGDLNAYAQEDPIIALKGHGYTNLIEQFTGTWAYSYVFDGQSGYLDHALASPSAQTAVTGVTEWHINADEPSALDYNSYNWAPLYNGDAYRASDHDPVLIGVSFKWIQFMPIVFKN